MADDRDKRRPLTPPAGVRAQIAPPSGPETWEDKHTGLTPVRATTKTGEESPVETIVRRTGQTKNMVLDVHTDVGTLTSRVTTLETKVDKIDAAVEAQGAQNTQIIGLTTDVISILKNRETVTTTTKLAEVEVTKTRAMTDIELDKTEKLADLEDRKATRAIRREWWKKAFVHFGIPVLTAAAALIVAYLTKCGR